MSQQLTSVVWDVGACCTVFGFAAAVSKHVCTPVGSAANTTAPAEACAAAVLLLLLSPGWFDPG
jgi:hypothetical protein